jgi:DNA-binding transcriptional LysR family regulator
MNPRGLRAVLSVADTGSVTAAARLLCLTQSGVSRQVATLEEEIGFALFDRQRGRLRLSRRGEAFISHLRRAMDALDNLPRAARSIADGAIGRVEVAATSAIIHGLLPPLISRYVAARPGLAPLLAMRSLSEIESLGADQRFDLVFVPAPMRPSGLV